jgi:hypothetical protein
MNSRNQNTEEPTVEFSILGLKLQKIPLRIILRFLTDVRFLVGITLGVVLTLYVSNNVPGLPLQPSLPPAPVIVVKEHDNNNPKFPEPVKYVMAPGEMIEIRIESAQSEYFNWSVVPSDFGQFIGDSTRNEVVFAAPNTTGRSGIVQVCDPDPITACRSGGWMSAINISVTK